MRPAEEHNHGQRADHWRGWGWKCGGEEMRRESRGVHRRPPGFAHARQMRGRQEGMRDADHDVPGSTPTTSRRSTKLTQRTTSPQVVINVALPYQDLDIMDACLAAGVDYLDTANYEPLDVAKFEIQLAVGLPGAVQEHGRMALLGSGFDPGVTNDRILRVRQKHLFDEFTTSTSSTATAAPRQGVRHELQSRDQHPRDHGARPLLGERRVEGDRPAQRVEDLRLPRRRRAEELPPLSRGARVAARRTSGPQAHPVLDDVRRELPQAPRGAAERRHDADRRGRVRRHRRSSRSSSSGRCLPDPASLAQGYTGKTSIGCSSEGIKDGKKEGVHLQHLRPRGDVQGGRAPRRSRTRRAFRR